MKIDKGIPLVRVVGRPLSPMGKLVRQMEPGDSMFFEVYRAADNCRYMGVHLGWSMATRKLPDGWRVWRMK